MDRSRSVMGQERRCRKEYLMRHNGFLFAAVVVAVAAFLLPAAIASAGSPRGERPRHVGEGQGGRHGYGFLPGYEPPKSSNGATHASVIQHSGMAAPDFTQVARMAAPSGPAA